MLRVIVGIAAHQRHHAHTGLEAGDAKSQLGEEQKCHPHHHQRVAVVCEQLVLPVGDARGVRYHQVEADAHDDEVQEQVGTDDDDREVDRLPEALEEDRAQGGYQYERDEQVSDLPGTRAPAGFRRGGPPRRKPRG